MRKLKRPLLFLLILCLAVLSLPALPASAVVRWLTFTQDARGGVSLEITGLDPQSVIHAVQVEAVLDGSYQAGDVVLSPADPDAYSPASATLVRQSGDKTVVNLYVVSEYALNEGDTLKLGSLTANGLGILPETVRVGLLDADGLHNPPPQGQQPVNMQEMGMRGTGTSIGVVLGSGHSIAAGQAEHGTCQVNPTAWQGQTVAVKLSPDEGYKVDSLTVAGDGGRTVTARDAGEGLWVFQMPAFDVRLTPSFAPLNQDHGLPFTDVGQNDWFYSAVRFVYERGMMAGTSADKFSPRTNTSRAMVVTILYRLDGSPETAPGSFPDVGAGQWYTDAVGWASQNGIVKGYSNGRFGPGDDITREQMAAILYRYAQHKNQDVSKTGDLSTFVDAGKVSGYAAAEMGWAVGSGLITGKDGNRLDPQGKATRSEAAAILTRFCQG